MKTNSTIESDFGQAKTLRSKNALRSMRALKYFPILGLFFSLIINQNLSAQQQIEATGENADTAAFLPATAQAQNLDLAAVLSVFQNSNGLEDFEKKLNEDEGVNNLDLNGDSLVDYIRVMEKEEGEYRVIIMQAIVADNEFQDVAYINIKKSGEEKYEVQAEGSDVIYGKNYYVSPEPTVHVHIHTWPVWSYMYVPNYRYYYSPYYYGYYPRWYRRYYYRPYDYYYNRVHVYHHGYYYHRAVLVHRPTTVYVPRHSKVIKTTPPVVGERGPRPSNNTSSQTVAPRYTKPGAPQNDVSRQSLEKDRTNAPSNNAASRSEATKRDEQARPGQPATRPETRPATRPTEPSTRPASRPETRPASKPAAKPATRPAARPASRPESKPAARPANRPASKPAARPANRPASKPAARPASRPASKPAARPASKPSQTKKATTTQKRGSTSAPSRSSGNTSKSRGEGR